MTCVRGRLTHAIESAWKLVTKQLKKLKYQQISKSNEYSSYCKMKMNNHLKYLSKAARTLQLAHVLCEFSICNFYYFLCLCLENNTTFNRVVPACVSACLYVRNQDVCCSCILFPLCNYTTPQTLNVKRHQTCWPCNWL